tara:strand:- start:82 stop:1170 length:1089 start_codon:yes stop_codon:yes gene_type:complete
MASLLLANKNFKNKVFVDDSIQPYRFSSLKYKSNTNKMEYIFKFNYVKDYRLATIIIFLVNSRQNLINLDSKYNYIFETNKPVIILERLDSAITWCRELSKIKNLKGVFKNRILRDFTLQNTENIINGKYNYYLQKEIVKSESGTKKEDIGNKNFKNEIKQKLSHDELNKIQCILWDFHSSPFKNDKENETIEMTYFRNNKINFNKNIDIFCINQTKNDCYVDDPRIIAKNIVDSLSDKYSVVTNKNKTIDSKKYRELFSQSKICVACWGFGEWVHMDAYAMYAGVILIKPNSDHVLMFPDIYKSYETYIPCNHDYSNLKEVLIDCLNNYEKYKNMLIKNREILKSINEFDICKIFWKNVFK